MRKRERENFKASSWVAQKSLRHFNGVNFKWNENERMIMLPFAVLLL